MEELSRIAVGYLLEGYFLNISFSIFKVLSVKMFWYEFFQLLKQKTRMNENSVQCN